MAIAGSAADAQRPDIDPGIRTVLDAAIDSLRRVSIGRDRVDWNQLRDSAFALARGAREIRDVYPVLEFILQRADHHSFLQAGWFGARSAIVGTGQRYVRVPSWNSGSASLADSIQTYLAALDTTAGCGWIVDLRYNGGGNMWPMLAGIGPLLGDSIVGSMHDRDGRSYWKYAPGRSILLHANGRVDTIVTAAVTPHVMRRPGEPVAVLIDSVTASSGEVIAVAFRGRPNTRFFGQPSAGKTTSNRPVRLPPNITMTVTTGVYVDRTGREYGSRIIPDVETPLPLRGPAMLDGDPAIAAATVWIRTHPVCN